MRFPTENPRDFTVPADYDPEQYRARPPWLIGPVTGTATISVGEDLAWWVKRLEPHLSWQNDSEGCAIFSAPYADEFLLLSWIAGLGGCSEILDPPELRSKADELLLKVAQAHAGTPPGAETSGPPESHPARTSNGHISRQQGRAGGSDRTADGVAPIAQSDRMVEAAGGRR